MVTRWLGWLLLVALSGACSSTGSEPTSATTQRSTADGADADDQAEVTVPAETTTTTADDETVIGEVHTRFMTELFAYDERTDDPDAFLALAGELTTGAQLERMESRVEASADLDERFASPGYESNIQQIEIDGDYATVRDCSLDRGETYSLDGALVTPAAEQYEMRETVLAHEAGRWLVTDFRTGGDQPCEP
jgi:hypothetical protein